jgi:hypothetical protein
MPSGAVNLARLPRPSVEPATPGVPASVVTSAVVDTRRMVEFPRSATKSVPFGRAATPDGALNRAALPAPSVDPGACRPACVDVRPAGVTCGWCDCLSRRRRCRQRRRCRRPAAIEPRSTSQAVCRSRRTCRTSQCRHHPVCVTLRIVWLPVSATMRCPTARWRGPWELEMCADAGAVRSSLHAWLTGEGAHDAGGRDPADHMVDLVGDEGIPVAASIATPRGR